MPDTVSIIRAEGKPLSVEAERKQHSDWVKQEAQLLMDELFVDCDESLDGPVNDLETVDVDWVDGLALQAPTQMTQTWASIDPDESEQHHWIPHADEQPFYQRFLILLAGLALVTPLGIWGTHSLRQASKPRSVIAATPLQTAINPSDADFAIYAEQALKQIQEKPNAPEKLAAVGANTLPTVQLGDRPLPTNLPPVAALPQQSAAVTPVAAPQAEAPTESPATQAELDRLKLRVFKPNRAVQSAVPPIATGAETVIPEQTLPAPPSIAPAAENELPTLAASTIAPSDIPSGLATPSTKIAAATPMNSPESASKKVIGIIELGVQSTLMVANNGSHLNFRVGDIVNDAGWKLVDITQGKAILQKGTEYKTLSEGQLF